MTVTFNLNGKRTTADIPANKRLVDILREDFALLNGKAGCYAGICGTCAVLLDGELINSCLVPAFAVQDRDIVTLKGLAGEKDAEDIIEGFRAADAMPCGNCLQSKTLAVYSLLTANPVPRREDIIDAIGWQRCACTDIEALCGAIERIAHFRRFHRHGGR